MSSGVHGEELEWRISVAEMASWCCCGSGVILQHNDGNLCNKWLPRAALGVDINWQKFREQWCSWGGARVEDISGTGEAVMVRLLYLW